MLLNVAHIVNCMSLYKCYYHSICCVKNKTCQWLKGNVFPLNGKCTVHEIVVIGIDSLR